MFKKTSSTLRKLQFMLLSVIVISTGVGIFISFYNVTTISRSVSEDNAKTNNLLFAKQIEGGFGSIIPLTLKLSVNTAIIKWMTNEDNVQLKNLALEELRKFAFISDSGEIIVGVDKSKNLYRVNKETTLVNFKPWRKLFDGQEATNDSWYIETSLLTDPYAYLVNSLSFSLTNKIFINSAVIDEKNKQYLGAMSGAIDFSKNLVPILNSFFIKNSYSTVIDRQGLITIDPNKELINKNIYTQSDNIIGSSVFFVEDEYLGQINAYLKQPRPQYPLTLGDGFKNKYLSISPITGTKWFAVSYYDNAILFKHNNLFLAIVMACALAFVFYWFLIRFYSTHFTLPILKMMNSFKNRDLYTNHKLYGIERDDEFGELARAVQDLTVRISNSVHVGIFINRSFEEYTYANSYFLKMFECESLEQFCELKRIKRHVFFSSEEELIKFYADLKNTSEGQKLLVKLKTASGREFWAETYVKVMAVEGKDIYYEGILIDVDSDIKEKEKLVNTMYRDALTGLRNRTFFNSVVLEEILKCRQARKVFFVLFDIDHFKVVNDTYGHSLGDDVLKNVANIATQSLRKQDYIIRWGGEEFLIVLIDCDQTGAFNMAERIRTSLESTMHPVCGKVTSSFGMAELVEDESIDNCMVRADKALYSAKRTGRNKVVEYQNCIDVQESTGHPPKILDTYQGEIILP